MRCIVEAVETTIREALHLCLTLFFSIHPAIPVVALIESDHAPGSTFGKLSNDEGNGNVGSALTLVSLPRQAYSCIWII